MSVLLMKDLDLKGKKVLIRQDLNVPIQNGAITSDVRIQASVPTIKLALERGAKVMLMSHLGRPTEGEYDEKFSLKLVAERLTDLLGTDVALIKDWREGIEVGEGKVVLLDNVRFNAGEKKDDEALA